MVLADCTCSKPTDVHFRISAGNVTTFDRGIWHTHWPWPRVGQVWRSRSKFKVTRLNHSNSDGLQSALWMCYLLVASVCYCCSWGYRFHYRHIKYSLDFLRPIRTAEAFEAVDWLADLPQRTWPQAGCRSSDNILTSFCWSQQPQSWRRPCLLGIVRRLQLRWLAWLLWFSQCASANLCGSWCVHVGWSVASVSVSVYCTVWKENDLSYQNHTWYTYTLGPWHSLTLRSKGHVVIKCTAGLCVLVGMTAWASDCDIVMYSVLQSYT